MERIKNAEVYLRTLIELFAGIIAFGIVCTIPLLFFTKRGYHICGLWYGIVIALLMAWHMWASVPKSVDSGEGGARKVSTSSSLVRYAAVIIIYGAICYIDFGNPLTAFLGIMGLKAAAYIEPLIHKLFMKLFSWQEIEYPPYEPEDEDDAYEYRT